jgi:hypothetical protein
MIGNLLPFHFADQDDTRVFYVLYSYPPASGATTSFHEDRRSYRTLDEARSEAKRRLGRLHRRYSWKGYEAPETGLVALEAYHEADKSGCGGVQISIPASVSRELSRSARSI